MGGRLFSSVAIAAAVLCVSACGSSSKPDTGTTAQPTTTTATAPAKPSEPKAQLSADEYKALVRAQKVGLGVKHPSPRKAMALIRKTCRELADAPATDLMVVERRGCARAQRFFAALFAFTTQKGECTKAVQAGDASCYGELFSRLARSTHSVISSFHEVNAALRRRKIRGKCAAVVGLSSPKELRDAAALGHDARRASQLLYAHYDLAAYVAKVNAVGADINALDNGLSDKQQLARLRRCPRTRD